MILKEEINFALGYFNNETTLRILCQRKSNAETFTHEFDIPTTSPTIEDKEDKKAKEIQHLKEKTTQRG